MRILDAYTRKAEIPVAEAVPPVKKLSPREIEILIEVSSGATNDEISGILFISANTVKNHLHNIIEKLGLKGRRELIEYAKQHGLIKTPK